MTARGSSPNPHPGGAQRLIAAGTAALHPPCRDFYLLSRPLFRTAIGSATWSTATAFSVADAAATGAATARDSRNELLSKPNVKRNCVPDQHDSRPRQREADIQPGGLLIP
ncbi:hypothetical protein MBOT_05840 [Mycobacterium botniense]|uniref:Uncharacterized protein n=1 Tax=Mycobacterium botniense TaxID=84962 RepID=A0A7I9XT83_9MYCO|nr:hypothetical protein MBOT_05840 [Mycobacterium botniense]